MRASLVASLACVLAGCTLITNPGRVRFDEDAAAPGMDAGPDAQLPDAGPDATRPDGGRLDAGDVDARVPDAGPRDGGGGPAVCGDGVVDVGEACDDGATTACGACNADCTGAGSGSACGDGSVCSDTEGCDDGDTAAGDGCSATCAVETGYACSGEPSTCTSGCGDGMVTAPETCDDGGNTDGDGCSAACAVERGWTCAAGTCAPICGDARVVGGEICDDGNTMPCGTCNATCSGPGTGRCPTGTGCSRGLDCERGLCDSSGTCAASCTGSTCDDPTLPYCENNVCNECDPATGAGCTAGSAHPYCGGTGGAGFECVECTDPSHCPSSRPICDFGTCRACAAFAECGGGGFDCCGGRCVNISTGDTSNCGACGRTCAIDEACMFSTCCIPTGSPCVVPADCCSGACSAGVCG